MQLQSTSGGEGDFCQADCLGDEGIRSTEENHSGKAKHCLFINCNPRAAKSRAGSRDLVVSDPLAFAFYVPDCAARRWECLGGNRAGVGGRGGGSRRAERGSCPFSPHPRPSLLLQPVPADGGGELSRCPPLGGAARSRAEGGR